MRENEAEGKEKEYLELLKGSPELYQAALLSLRDRGGSRRGGLREEGLRALDLAGSLVFGPALSSFLLWLLGDALRRGKERIYFLARDGYFFWKGALLLCKEHSLPLDCRYVSCSRYSLRVPCFHRDHREALEFLCRDGLRVTPEGILRRAALTREESLRVLQELSLPWEGTEALPRWGLSLMRERLRESELFFSLMDARSRQALPLLERYLCQEGLREAAGDCLADSGWMGSLQKTLGEVLSGMGRKSPLEGYYWGLYDLPTGARERDYRCFFFSPEKGAAKKALFHNCLFEAVFTAPHGMTLGYRACGEKLFPVYAPLPEDQKALTLRLGEGMLAYTAALSKALSRRDFFEEDKKRFLREGETLKGLFASLMAKPSLEEARAFGSLAFSDDVLEGEEGPLAAPALPLKESLKSGRPFGESAWYPGSAVLAGDWTRARRRTYLSFQRLRHLKKSLAYRKRKRKGDIRP